MLPSLSKSLLWLAAAALPLASAERIIESKSLNPCMENSAFSATLFLVTFTPNNRSFAFDVEGISNIAGNIDAFAELLIYGYPAMSQKIDPCAPANKKALQGLCPMNAGPLTINSNYIVDQDIVNKLPAVAYTVPDLDVVVRVRISQNGTQLACVEAELSNGKTVDQKAVKWVTAIIAGLGLMASAITSGMGHSNTAAHVAANAMSLFGYFQAQAFLGMSPVPLPPIVAAWTQNFQWTMGIIRVGFLQKLATWYQRATGGTPSTQLLQLAYTSVEVQKVKRAVSYGADSLAHIMARSNTATTTAQSNKNIVLRGIERVGFKARIESTNIFFTGYTFFVIFVILVVVSVVAFKYVCEGLAKADKLKGDKFVEFRNGWQTILKGILFRVVLIGFPQMMVLGFWELTRRDSAGLMVLAILSVIAMIGILGWASSKVVRIAQRSITMHKNPAYILYSDPVALNKWGFLYVQFKATAYWFIIPWLGYLLLKAMFLGFAQKSGKVQAVANFLIELALLVGVCYLRPWMDKKTNGFNIAICSINFLGAFFLLFFSELFHQPAVVAGAMGLVYFVVNAAFSLVLLVMLLVASGYALFTKNPDTRYQPMRDDRGSFIKSQSQLTTELDALGATARGEGKSPNTFTQSRSRIDDDEEVASEPKRQSPVNGEHYMPAPQRSPGSTSPMQPSFYDRRSPAPAYGRPSPGPGPGPDAQFRRGNNASPWQRGAGYDH